MNGSNERRVSRHRLRNLAQTAILLGAMTTLLVALGWLFAGGIGVIWAVGLGAFGVAVGAPASGVLLLRLYRARPLPREEAPVLHAVADELAERAGIVRTPALYYIPSRMMQAFTVPVRGGVAVAFTDGLLRGMESDEAAAVLAHEMSHVRHHDVRIMALADMVTKVTRFLSLFGIILVFLNLPLILMGQEALPWTAVVLLMFAPTISVLLQLALSRAREFDADLGAVELCGDPQALASALVRLERYQGRLLTQMLLPGYRLPEPSLLRSHPVTDERVRRLSRLPPGRKLRSLEQPVPTAPAHRWTIPQSPRWRRSGFWY